MSFAHERKGLEALPPKPIYTHTALSVLLANMSLFSFLWSRGRSHWNKFKVEDIAKKHVERGGCGVIQNPYPFPAV